MASGFSRSATTAAATAATTTTTTTVVIVLVVAFVVVVVFFPFAAAAIDECAHGACVVRPGCVVQRSGVGVVGGKRVDEAAPQQLAQQRQPAVLGQAGCEVQQSLACGRWW